MGSLAWQEMVESAGVARRTSRSVRLLRVQHLGETLVYSASDLTGFLACAHLTQLEKRAARGLLERPIRHDPLIDLLTQKGLEHERQFKQTLESAGLAVTSIDPPSDRTLQALVEGAAKTEQAMRDGDDVVYQAVLFDGNWRGYADFLRKIEKPSDLGNFGYEVLDTKLARSPKASAVLQLCNYSDQVARIQGVDPEEFHLVLGDGGMQSYRFADYSAYYRMMRRLFDEAIAGDPDTYPDPVDHCQVCRWWGNCNEQRRGDDHLTFVAQIRRDQIKHLVDEGLSTLAALAESTPELKVPGIAPPSFTRLRDQAEMQLEKRQTNASKYKLLERPGPGYGLERLPVPSKGDIFFDIESDQFAEQEGLEFLFGWVDAGSGEPIYHSDWAHSAAEEKAMFERFIDLLTERRKEFPEMHVYHYAPYETIALKRLMGRHATREEELDRLLRGLAFVDLFQVVRQSMRISEESYSIKKIEVFYMPARTDRITESSSATIEYENYRDTGDKTILQDLEEYNEADCISLVHLQKWLEGLRIEAAKEYGEELTRPGTPEDKSDEIEKATEEVRDCVESLAAGLPPEPESWSESERGSWLLAQLLNWHRREDKSEWWLHFDRLGQTPVELIDDSDCLGGLTYEGPVEEVARSIIHKLTFPPQEHKIGPGGEWLDPVAKKGVTVTEVNNDERFVLIRRAKARTDSFPEALMPGPPIPNWDQRRALLQVGNDVVSRGIEADGAYPAAHHLILRRPPRVTGLKTGDHLKQPNEKGSDASSRLALVLDRTYLAIQGPPGTGKSYSGGRMILELVRAGRKVGITATSHKVISNLLKGACKAAANESFPLKALQQCPEGEVCAHDLVTGVGKRDEFNEAWSTDEFHVAAGTAWLWCRAEMDHSVDTLFIDEAGQFSLANAIAVSVAADNLVLLGDPQQLAQPSNGVHPPGAGVSVLEHVLNGHATIDDSLGIFLEKTWRMHPHITRFISEAFYDGRLESEPGCAGQALAGSDFLPTPGIYLLPIAHEGNRIASREEAAQLKLLLSELAEKEWTTFEGTTKKIEAHELLVVAPYNAQVSLIRRTLGVDIPVGTVDKFQGQEGAVAIYSMTTSHPEDIPRNFDFLYSHNRLNVAISRARVAGVLICSPQLLRARCKTPEQMRLMNALCLYAEMARTIP